MYVYDDWEDSWEYVKVPYSRNILPSEESRVYERFFMKIGRTERTFLSGARRIISTLLGMSPSVPFVYNEGTVDGDDDSEDSGEEIDDDYYTGNSWVPTSIYGEKYWSDMDDESFAFLDTANSRSSSSSDTNDSTSASSAALQYSTGTIMIEVRQGTYAYTKVTDVDPVNIPALLGNIGGFWGYVLFIFAVFFGIAEPDSEPKLRARAFFTKSGVVSMKQYVTKSGASRSGRPSLEATGEQLPDWEEDGEGKETGTYSKETMKLPAVQHHNDFPSGGCFKRPVEDQAPKRRTSNSSGSTPSSYSIGSQRQDHPPADDLI